MADDVYDYLKRYAKDVDFAADTIKVRLMASSYAFDPAHATMADVGAGLGDVTVTGKSEEMDVSTPGAHFAFWKSTVAPVFSGLTTGSTFASMVLYKFITDDAGSKPLLCYGITATPTITGVDVQFDWASDANGGVHKIA